MTIPSTLSASVVAYDAGEARQCLQYRHRREAAESAALGHVGLSESQVAGLRSERDYDDGRLEYEVEFRSGGMGMSTPSTEPRSDPGIRKGLGLKKRPGASLSAGAFWRFRAGMAWRRSRLPDGCRPKPTRW